jgi:thiamine-phosphate pyrophosphorylase
MNDFGLYVIISNPVLPYTEIAEICVSEGIKYLQLREKELSDRRILEISNDIISITKGSRTKFIINDRVDLAIITDADGVHLGQDDISIDQARRLLANDKIIGISTHNLKQAENALLKTPDYIGFGPIFKTPTKKIPDPVLGTEQIPQLINLKNKMNNDTPFVAIGGIDNTNINDVISSGAKNFSLVRFLMESPDLKKRLKMLKDLYQK